MTELLSSPVALLLFQIACILAVSRAFGVVFRLFGQPLVVAEIIAGIALGPSLLGEIAPTAMATLFPASSLVGLSAVSQIGLVLFMFVIGLEFDLRLVRNLGPIAVVVSVFALLLPFVLGMGFALVSYPIFSTADVPFTGFALFSGAAMAVTAFPVLARILSERGLLSTRTGALALTCAAVGDVAAWCLLAFVIAVVRSGGLYDAIGTTVKALIYVAVMLGVIRPFLSRLARRYATAVGFSQTVFAAIVGLLLVSALVSEAIHIHALFGAFLFGAIVPREGSTVRLLIERVEYLVLVVLLPLFFAFTGLRTRIGLVDTPELWGWVAVVTGIASVGKLLGGALPARLAGVGWRESATLGVLLNTRGLMELIILNIGLDLGVLSPLLFTMLVIMAVATTVITSPVVRLLFPPDRVLADRLPGGRVRAGGVLAAVSDPTSAPGIAHLVAALCSGGRGPACALRLIPLAESASLFPEQSPMPERGENDAAAAVAREARALGVEVEPVTLTSDNPAQAIVDAARLRDASLLVLGLHRPLLGTARLGGPILQVAQRAERDVCMLHDRGLRGVTRVLLAMSGGEMDAAAERVAERLAAAPGVELRRFSGVGRADAVKELIESATADDLVVLGVGGEWELPLVPIEIRPSRLFRDLPCSLLVVHGEPVA